MYPCVVDIAINSSAYTHVGIFMFFIKMDFDEFFFVGKKYCIFTENYFSMDFMFGNFLVKFLGALHYFKIFNERKIKT